MTVLGDEGAPKDDGPVVTDCDALPAADDAPAEATRPPRKPLSPLVEALAASVLVTGVVTGVSVTVPDKYVATSVGFVFLAATWLLGWRRDDAWVKRAGLALGGLVLPGELGVKRLFRSAAVALAWALAFSAVTFVPFYFGWRYWWAPKLAFSLTLQPQEIVNEAFGQLIVIALPEEAFYRGYLQSRIDDAWGARRRLRVFGAELGPAILVASAIFALGHMATIHQPARLAVFFPALLFGWLRVRTGGIGAALVFHAICNIFSELLGRGYGVY